MKRQLNACDGGHETTQQIRRLPLGGAAVLVCKNHYQREIKHRKNLNKSLDKDSQFELPAWESLQIVED